MKLFLLGATGRTGSEILDLALGHGHHVTAFVRSPQKLCAHERLTVVAGDVRDRAALAAAMRGHDAVAFALGAYPRDALFPSTVMTDWGTAALAAMKDAGISRMTAVSAAVLFPADGWFFAFFQWLLRHHARDLRAMEAAIEASGSAYTIVRPPQLVRSKDVAYREAVDALPPNGRKASFRAVASFCLDALERNAHVREVVGIAQ